MYGKCSENWPSCTEDMVHLDLYDTKLEDFVDNGEWVMVLTTLLFEGEKTGTLLLNHDTEDISVVCFFR